MWKKINDNKDKETKIQIGVRNYLKMMYRDSKVDFSKVYFKITADYQNNKIIISFKQGNTTK